MSNNPAGTHDAIVAAAKEANGNVPDWEPYLFEKIANGLLVTGSLTRPKKTGPNKGQPKYMDEGKASVFVGRDDVERHKDHD